MPLAPRRCALHAEPVAKLLFNAHTATHCTKGGSPSWKSPTTVSTARFSRVAQRFRMSSPPTR
eukprot:1797910-Lingulodinium_polyedra.AAC.1